MIDASNGNGLSATTPPQGATVQNGEASAAPSAEFRESRDQAVSETTRPQPATLVSRKKIEANRRNAQHSTGPTSEAGKAASRLNALKHGLLAKEVVITRGDYQEDDQQFAQLLEELSAQFTPVGVAEELEVEKIALCYWRKMRAVRYEHGAIRTRTAGLRWREELRRRERFDRAFQDASGLEESSRGIQALIDWLGGVKEEALSGRVSAEDLDNLRTCFPNEPLPDGMESGDESAEEHVAASPEFLRGLADFIDEELRRLAPLREKVAKAEELDLDSKIRSAALPGPGVVDKLIRYETSIERELDRALNRLERMQERRRENCREGGTASGGA